MTIKNRLYISFSLILAIVAFMIGVFFYTIYNLNTINYQQNHRYDQLIRVEKLKEFNSSYAWVVLDIITDYDKVDIVKERIKKANKLFENLTKQKMTIINNSEALEEKENLIAIFKNFEQMQHLIIVELYGLVINQTKDYTSFNKIFESVNGNTQKLLDIEVDFLQGKLQETQTKREHFLDTIKLEMVLLFMALFLMSFMISSKIISEIKNKLKRLNLGVLQLFKQDEKTIKVDIGENNELSEITNNLNDYLEKQEDIIHSREELLRNISHELKTPIAKGRFMVQKIKSSEDAKVLKDINTVFYDIEKLTSKLLEREKLNFAILKRTQFKASSLILESLSKLSIEDESKVTIDLQDDFNINADFYYMTIGLKNLIDNAMKYAEDYPIVIEVNNKKINIKNLGNKLSNDLIYYIQPFTREPNQQQGHGLGLNIVSKILTLHGYELTYQYEAAYNSFTITFK